MNSNTVQAYTTPYGNIILTRALTNKLTYNETLSVGYHEVGHRVLNHFGKFMDYYYEHYPLKRKELQYIKHKHELEADLFSVKMDIQTHKKIYLPSALEKISPKKYYKHNTDTHPATEQRIKYMKKYYNRDTKYEKL